MNYFLGNMLPEERNALPDLRTTAAFVSWITERYGDQPALSNEKESVTYRELRQRVAGKRHLLARMGMPNGTNVGLLDVNSVEEVEWFLAVTSYGCCAVMLPPSMSPEVLRRAADHYELSALIQGDSFASKTEGLSLKIISMHEMDEEGSDPKNVQATDLAAIFFTGGTTGTPKGVMLSHQALMRGAKNGTYRRGTIYGQTLVAALPFTHVFGMIFSMLSGLYCGSHVGVCSEMRLLFREMGRVRPTTMIAVPGMAELMLSVAKAKGIEALGGRLKLIICGAAPVPAKLREGFDPLGVEVLAGYGLTETANLVSGNLDMSLHPDSVGKQYPDQEYRLVEGELQVRGDMLFDGYWKDEAATQAAMTQDGWFRTGDLARVDTDGFLYIVGRSKNLIILSNGENVSPEEVEAAFYRSPCVRECLVSETDINGKPAILLEVVPAPGVDEEIVMSVLKTIREELPSPMRPARMILRKEEFEKSASMKIVRKKG